MFNEPLVSIIVISYNSSKYILETLDSAKNQTYANIELIISDDGSTDGTTKLCEKWLSKNHIRFKNTQLIKFKDNTGISANCNRALKESSGEWIKFIAGDDLLLENCISINIENTMKYNFPLFVSDMEVFDQTGILLSLTENYNKAIRWFGNKSQKEKTKSYLRFPIMLNIPTYFVKKSIVIDVGGFDNDFKFLEDTPFFTRFFLKKYDMHHIPAISVRYRKHINNTMNPCNNSFYINQYNCYLKYSRVHLSNYNPLDLIFKIYRDIFFWLLNNNYGSGSIFKFYSRIINRIVHFS